jgi:hypothetical protein
MSQYHIQTQCSLSRIMRNFIKIWNFRTETISRIIGFLGSISRSWCFEVFLEDTGCYMHILHREHCFRAGSTRASRLGILVFRRPVGASVQSPRPFVLLSRCPSDKSGDRTMLYLIAILARTADMTVFWDRCTDGWLSGYIFRNSKFPNMPRSVRTM